MPSISVLDVSFGYSKDRAALFRVRERVSTDDVTLPHMFLFIWVGGLSEFWFRCCGRVQQVIHCSAKLLTSLGYSVSFGISLDILEVPLLQTECLSPEFHFFGIFLQDLNYTSMNLLGAVWKYFME